MQLQDVRCCDFCNDPNAPYVWAFRGQTIPVGTPMKILQELIIHPEWFACAYCHQMLQNRNVTSLLDHNKDIKTPEQRKYLARFYQSLIDNLQTN